jgi:hypothetical protein
MTKKREKPQGFTCTTCSQYHAFALYVLAHWNEPLTHTCKCGAQHYVLRGNVRQIKEGTKP